MSHQALDAFVRCADDVVTSTDHPVETATEVGNALKALLAHPEFLEPRFRREDEEKYAQHIVHVHPEGRYSIVSLVWKPGQMTPVHDHVCWCVVGVLIGTEYETRYELASGGRELVEAESTRHGPGSVAVVVPPMPNIHRVHNVGEGTAISIHVYGADIAKLGTSINRTFDQPIRTAAVA